jgi:hypothetical protein
VADAVVFLVGAGEFVLLDDAFVVFLAARDGYEAGLRVRAHDLAVEVEAGFGVQPQRAVGDEFVEVLAALRIDGRVVEIGGGREIDFRFADVEEAEGIAGGELAGFVRRHHVVGQLADAGGEFRFRTQGGEWFEGGHKRGRSLGRARGNAREKCGGAAQVTPAGADQAGKTSQMPSPVFDIPIARKAACAAWRGGFSIAQHAWTVNTSAASRRGATTSRRPADFTP